MLINRLFWSETFASQVRAIASLAALLEALGDPAAGEVLRTAVKYEPEAEMLDNELRELREEIIAGRLLGFPPDVRARMEKLRLALERFRAQLLVSLEEQFGGKVPVVRGE